MTEGIIIGLIAAISQFIITYIKGRFDMKKQGNEIQSGVADIKETLNKIIEDNKGMSNSISEIRTLVMDNRYAIKHDKRYRLFHDMSRDLHNGYTTIDEKSEITELYESYKVVGGNSVIDDLYSEFMKLPTKTMKKIKKG